MTPKRSSEVDWSRAPYHVDDIYEIMKRTLEDPPWVYFEELEQHPFNVPYWLAQAKDAFDEEPTKKQLRKIYKRYYREWNIFLRDHTKGYFLTCEFVERN